MSQYRPYALACLLVIASAGCGGSASTAAKQVATGSPASSSAQPSAVSSPPTSSPATSNPATSSRTVSKAATSSSAGKPAPPTMTLPPNLCSATDIAQNAADAYIGALSAGNAREATACVLPHTVPSSVTRSLLGTAGATAVYLPRDGVDGPSVFGYAGNGKAVDVTVTKESDGKFWVTKVVVRPS